MQLLPHHYFLFVWLIPAFFCASTTSADVATSSQTPKVYIFDCGELRLDDVSSFGLTNDETDVREMFVPCYMIEHAGKRLLWDAGLPLALAGKGTIKDPAGYELTYKVSLLDQLDAMQLAPEDFDYIALSHFHFDHAGAANAFTQATLLIQETEYQAAFMDYANNPVFNHALYKELATNKVIKINGNYDVFGDGAVELIASPGHTPGHQVLFVNLKNYGPLVLSGDLYHFEESRSLKRTPEFNTDREQTLRSMQVVESLIKQRKATLWIEHVKAQSDTLHKAPNFYD